MFCHNNKAFLFAWLKDAAGAALKKVAPALGSGQQKIGSGSTLKVAATGGSGSARLALGRFVRASFHGLRWEVFQSQSRPFRPAPDTAKYPG